MAKPVAAGADRGFPISFIRAGGIKESRGWHCFYDTRTQTFSTDLDSLNKMNTKL